MGWDLGGARASDALTPSLTRLRRRRAGAIPGRVRSLRLNRCSLVRIFCVYGAPSAPAASPPQPATLLPLPARALA